MQENRCYLGLLMTPFLKHINNALPAHNLPRGRTAFQLKRQQQNYLHYIFKIPISIYCKRGIFFSVASKAVIMSDVRRRFLCLRSPMSCTIRHFALHAFKLQCLSPHYCKSSKTKLNVTTNNQPNTYLVFMHLMIIKYLITLQQSRQRFACILLL